MGAMGFQYLLFVRVKQSIDLPMHALRPLEGQCLRGLLGLFLQRKPQGKNVGVDPPLPKVLPSTTEC